MQRNCVSAYRLSSTSPSLPQPSFSFLSDVPNRLRSASLSPPACIHAASHYLVSYTLTPSLHTGTVHLTRFLQDGKSLYSDLFLFVYFLHVDLHVLFPTSQSSSTNCCAPAPITPISEWTTENKSGLANVVTQKSTIRHSPSTREARTMSHLLVSVACGTQREGRKRVSSRPLLKASRASRMHWNMRNGLVYQLQFQHRK